MSEKYFDIFKERGIVAVHNDWNGSEDVKDEQVLLAVYSHEDYSGNAFILFWSLGGVLMEAHDGHCSCHGLDNWQPEETTWAALKMRDYSEYGTEFNEAFKALVSQHE